MGKSVLEILILKLETNLGFCLNTLNLVAVFLLYYFWLLQTHVVLVLSAEALARRPQKLKSEYITTKECRDEKNGEHAVICRPCFI